MLAARRSAVARAFKATLMAGSGLLLLGQLQPALAQTGGQPPPTAAPNPYSGQGPAPAAPLGGGVAGPTTAAPNPPAAAAGGGNTIGEIVVTAQRRSENLQNVPIAVTALTGGALAKAGVQGTSDLNGVVPGLNFTSSIGAYGLPTIRGVGTGSQGPGIENPVATYIDGVYIVSAAGSLLSLHDISQVAVLKGPQGTLFGRNATGGLIQVTTLDPTITPHFDIDGSIGNRQYSAEDVYVSGQIFDKLTGNFAASNDDLLGGFGHNLYNGQKVQTHRSSAMRGKLQWKPDGKTTITLSADYSKYKSTDPAIRTIDENTLVGPTPGGPRDIDTNVMPSLHTEQWGTSLNVRHDFEGFQVVSISAYRQTALDTRFDGDQTFLSIPFTPNAVENNERDSQVSEELQVLSTTKGAFNWVAGAYYLHSRGAYDPATIELPEAGEIVQNVNQDLDSYSLFAQGTYKFDPATSLTAGIRYTLDHRTFAGVQDQPAFYPGAPTTVYGNESKDFSAPTARVSLDHRFSPELLAYVSYNRGFKSGTFSPQNISPVVEVQPETLNAYEAGIKTDLFDRRVRFNLAGFYYDYSNKQVQIINAGEEFLYDAKKAEMYGLDADLTWRVTENLTLTAGVSAIHATYTDFTDAPVTTVLASGGNTITTGSVSGNNIEDTPPWTLNIGPSYRLPTQFGDFNFNLNYYHNAGWYAEPDNRIRQPSYDLLNADIMFVPAFYPHLSVDVWGKNLTDAVYASQLNETQYGDNRVAAPGETYGLTVAFHY